MRAPQGSSHRRSKLRRELRLRGPTMRPCARCGACAHTQMVNGGSASVRGRAERKPLARKPKWSFGFLTVIHLTVLNTTDDRPDRHSTTTQPRSHRSQRDQSTFPTDTRFPQQTPTCICALCVRRIGMQTCVPFHSCKVSKGDLVSRRGKVVVGDIEHAPCRLY